MKELTLGIWKSKDLAEWFGITAASFANRKKKKLEELKEYCVFEDLGKKGVDIIEIYNPYYRTKVRELVHQHFFECWGYEDEVVNGNNMNDTCRAAAQKFITKYGDKGLKESTIITYFNQEKIALFGKTGSKQRPQNPGPMGNARYVFCKYIDGEYLDFTPEEKEKKQKLYKALGLHETNLIDFEEMAMLREAKNEGELSIDEYIKYCDERNEVRWNIYVAALEEMFDCTCTRATHLTIDENGNRISEILVE